MLSQPSRPNAAGADGLNLETCTVEIEGVSFTFDVANSPEKPWLFALGVRKSGSTMLYKLVIQMAKLNGYEPIDVPGTLFRKGAELSSWREPGFGRLIKGGNVFLGFRALPDGLDEDPLFKQARKIFMHRDPRDALVSQFYSDAYSHSLPEEDAAVGSGRSSFLAKREEALRSEINEWVLSRAEAMRKTMSRYVPVLGDPQCLVLRYEEYVFQKRRMIYKILKHFNWRMKPEDIDQLLARIDIRPEKEEPTQFVRKAVPGDHTSKLTPKTVEQLNVKLKDILVAYDYY